MSSIRFRIILFPLFYLLFAFSSLFLIIIIFVSMIVCNLQFHSFLCLQLYLLDPFAMAFWKEILFFYFQVAFCIIKCNNNSTYTRRRCNVRPVEVRWIFSPFWNERMFVFIFFQLFLLNFVGTLPNVYVRWTWWIAQLLFYFFFLFLRRFFIFISGIYIVPYSP